MSKQTLDTTGLEETYRLLAEAIDNVGSEQEALFLTKLVMILANELGDLGLVRGAIENASEDL